MADALCGPSNALQNFQKHASVDRTLQQDRLVGRHSPAQGFRSSPGPNAGVVDSEFDAFQQGRLGPVQPQFQQFPQQFATPAPQFAHVPQAPDWASDFQQLNISNQPAPALQLRPQGASAASAWHQDFMRQQTPAAPAQQQTALSGMQNYGIGGFAGPSYMQNSFQPSAPMSQVAQGKQAVQEPSFDEAAFEQAFAQAQQDAMDEAAAEAAAEAKRAQSRAANPEVMGEFTRPSEDPLLIRIRETRPAVYSAIQVWSEMGLGRTEEAVSYLDNMGVLERSGDLVQDANEARWIIDSLQRIVNRGAPQEVKTRAEGLIAAINQRIMSQYPLGARIPMSQEPIWQELDEAGYMKTPQNEMVQQEQEPKQQDEQPKMNDDDEMAATAGRLLERVADNTSEKFQNSQFLELMRRLRDREVRVEGDKMVEVNDQLPNGPQSAGQTSTPRSGPAPINTATQIPGVDPNILNYAATDFELPVYYETPKTTTSTLPIAREQGAIPAGEQDEDRWRHALPGRDPVRKATEHPGYFGSVRGTGQKLRPMDSRERLREQERLRDYERQLELLEEQTKTRIVRERQERSQEFHPVAQDLQDSLSFNSMWKV